MCDSGPLLRRIIREPAIKSPVLSLLFKEDGKSVKQGVTLIFFLIRGVGTFQKVTTRGNTFSEMPNRYYSKTRRARPKSPIFMLRH